MIRERIIRKIFYTTFIFFIILVMLSFRENKSFKENKTNYPNDLVNIYLLNNDNYLTEVMVLISDKNNYLSVYEIIDQLKNNNKYYESLHGIIPNNTKINHVELKDNILYIDFNNELLNVSEKEEEKIIESLIYSLTNLSSVYGLKISINDVPLSILPKSNIKLDEILTRDFGINKEYYIYTTNNIEKMVLYYYQEIDNNNYYVPITKYINNKNDKIKVIIDNLKNSYLYKTNLMSYLNNRIKLLSYSQYDDMITLSFDNLITLDSSKAQEEVIYTVSNSIFDSMHIKKIIFMEKDKIVTIKENNNLFE